MRLWWTLRREPLLADDLIHAIVNRDRHVVVSRLQNAVTAHDAENFAVAFLYLIGCRHQIANISRRLAQCSLDLRQPRVDVVGGANRSRPRAI